MSCIIILFLKFKAMDDHHGIPGSHWKWLSSINNCFMNRTPYWMFILCHFKNKVVTYCSNWFKGLITGYCMGASMLWYLQGCMSNYSDRPRCKIVHLRQATCADIVLYNYYQVNVWEDQVCHVAIILIKYMMAMYYICG